MSVSDTPDTLYLQVAQQVEGAIRAGGLREGERIPSIRRFSRQLNVSVSTVSLAYQALERKGLIVARERSGFFVASERRMPPEPVTMLPAPYVGDVTVGELIAQVLKAGRDPELVPLGIGSPHPSLFPQQRLSRILRQVCLEQPESFTRYDYAPGTSEFRKEIARYALEVGYTVAPDEIVTTCGAMEAIFLSLRAVAGPGDAIAVEAPCYYGFLQALEALGMRAVEIPSHPVDGICLEDLEQAIVTHGVKACLLMPTFNNPTGVLLSDAKKRALVELITRHGVPLIEDDLHGDLALDGSRPKPCKAFDTQGLVILCASFSKTLSPGLRVGWCAAGRFQQRIELLKVASTLSGPGLSQIAIARFLQHGGYRHHLKGMHAVMRDAVDRAVQAVLEAFPTGTKVGRPQGGFYLWLELPESLDSRTVFRLGLEHGVCTTPGPVFSASGSFQSCLRLSCCHPWSPRIAEGIETLGRLTHQLLEA
ncbi:putative HTH-type transcriptional regulator YdcR [compost metagenome]